MVIKTTTFIFSIFVISILLFPQPFVQAQEITQIPTPNELEIIKDEYKNLKEQNNNLMVNIQHERDQHYKFIEDTYNQAKGILLLVVGLLAFFGWSTTKGIRKDAKDLAEKNYRKVIEENSVGLSDRFQQVNTIIQRETIFISKKIGFIYKDAKISEIQEMIDVLNRRGFKNVFPMEINGKTDVTKLNANTFEVFIYFVADFDKEKDLFRDKVIKAVEGVGKPIILFTNNRNDISNSDMDDLIKLHKWILFSNNRISLLNSIFIVSNLYSNN